VIVASFGGTANNLTDGETLVFQPEDNGMSDLVAKVEIGNWPSLVRNWYRQNALALRVAAKHFGGTEKSLSAILPNKLALGVPWMSAIGAKRTLGWLGLNDRSWPKADIRISTSGPLLPHIQAPFQANSYQFAWYKKSHSGQPDGMPSCGAISAIRYVHSSACL
jgi:hypothetical protein